METTLTQILNEEFKLFFWLDCNDTRLEDITQFPQGILEIWDSAEAKAMELSQIVNAGDSVITFVGTENGYTILADGNEVGGVEVNQAE